MNFNTAKQILYLNANGFASDVAGLDDSAWIEPNIDLKMALT